MQSDRYPQYLCGDCESRAVDADGARVVGYNSSPTGGFELHWPDGEHPPKRGVAHVWVDGREWEYTEARFGGTLILPLDWASL